MECSKASKLTMHVNPTTAKNVLQRFLYLGEMEKHLLIHGRSSWLCCWEKIWSQTPSLLSIDFMIHLVTVTRELVCLHKLGPWYEDIYNKMNLLLYLDQFSVCGSIAMYNTMLVFMLSCPLTKLIVLLAWDPHRDPHWQYLRLVTEHPTWPITTSLSTSSGPYTPPPSAHRHATVAHGVL